MARKLKRMYNLRAKWYHRIFFTTFWLLLKIIYCKIQQIEFTESMMSMIRSPFRNRPQFPFASSTPSYANTTPGPPTRPPPFNPPQSVGEPFFNPAFARLPDQNEINLMGGLTPSSLPSEFNPSNPFFETEIYESAIENQNIQEFPDLV